MTREDGNPLTPSKLTLCIEVDPKLIPEPLYVVDSWGHPGLSMCQACVSFVRSMQQLTSGQDVRLIVLGDFWGLLTARGCLTFKFVWTHVTNARVLPRLVSHSRSNPYIENGRPFFQLSINVRIVTRRFEFYYAR